MEKVPKNHILLINTGKDAVRTLRSALEDTTIQSVYSRNIIIHVTSAGVVQCINRNTAISEDLQHIFIRRRGRTEEFCGIISELFSQKGIPVSDPINLNYTNSESKMAQMPRLAAAGLRVPETILMTAKSYTANQEYIESHFSYPLVYKENGSRGEKVFLLHSFEELTTHLKTLSPSAVVMLQAVIQNDYDTRTLVAYNTVLGTISRTAKAGAFHNNFSKGGSVAGYKLTEAEQAIALKAAAVCKLDFGGVDFIHSEHGPIILEVNKSPQITGFETIYGKGTVFTKIAELWNEKFVRKQ